MRTGSSTGKFNPSSGDLQTLAIQPCISSFFLLRSGIRICVYILYKLQNKELTEL
jgi:hypothetical protein